MRRKSFRDGFTLVEVALSTAFVGVLSITIVLIVNDTVAAYRRGLVLSQVNTTGMDIVDDMRTAVANSSSRSVVEDCVKFYGGDTSITTQCEDDGAYNFIAITKTAKVQVMDDTSSANDNVPVFGAFCTGTYSYIWNSGYFESDQARVLNVEPATLTYRSGGKLVTISTTTRKLNDGSVVDTNKPFRLLKVKDTNRAVCSSVVRYDAAAPTNWKNNYKLPANEDISSDFDISAYGEISEEPVDLILADNENDLVIYELLVARPAESTTRQNTFYSVSFILGTINGGINIRASGQSCSPPSDYKYENFDYCAINKFNFAMQASGGRNGE